MDIRFYHLQISRLDTALPAILEKALGAGYKAYIKTATKDDADHLDRQLWTYRDEGFLPHGFIDDEQAAHHPILIGAVQQDEAYKPANDANMIVLTGGTEEAELAQYDLCCEMLNGNNPDEVAAARTRWKKYKEDGHNVTYWAQDDAGRWAQKA